MLECRGIVVVPLRKRIKSSGYVRDMIGLSYIDDIALYAKRKNYIILYLSYSKGIVFYDTYLKNEVIKETSDLWCNIVSEQMVRMCLKIGTSKIILLSRFKKEFSGLVYYFKKRGLVVSTPLEGYKEDVIPTVLQLL